MATVHKDKISSFAGLAAGATHQFHWNNPPWDTGLAYFAYPDPPAAIGEHGTRTGSVEITRIVCVHKRDNHNGDHQHVLIDVKNTGSEATDVDLYQIWVT